MSEVVNLIAVASYSSPCESNKPSTQVAPGNRASSCEWITESKRASTHCTYFQLSLSSFAQFCNFLSANEVNAFISSLPQLTTTLWKLVVRAM